MKGPDRLLTIAALTLGLTEGGFMIAGQKGRRPPNLNSPTPITFVPTEGILVSPTVLPSSTEFPTLTPAFTSTLSSTSETLLGKDKCVLPLNPPFVISQGFLNPLTEHGKPLFADNGIRKRHLGVDLVGNLGDTVSNICSGVLTWRGTMPKEAGLGNVVVITDIKTGNVLFFAHLREFTNKKLGEKIPAGEKIGEVGSVGNSTGPHLDLTILSPYGWLIWKNGTKNSYDGDYSQSLNRYWGILETISDEEAALRLVNPTIYLYQVAGKEIWKLAH